MNPKEKHSSYATEAREAVSPRLRDGTYDSLKGAGSCRSVRTQRGIALAYQNKILVNTDRE